MLVTNRTVQYRAAPYGHVATIPEGTPVIPATNLPDSDQYWAEAWDDMSDQEESWLRNYGFLIDADDVDCTVTAENES